MTDFITVDEILEMAVAREVDANRFFVALAERVDDPAMRKIFEQLAEEELEHKEMLELEIIKRGKTVDTKKMFHGLQDEKYDYTIPKFDIDYRDLLLMGIKKEQTSFRLYVDLAGMVAEADAKEMLLELAEQELKHKLRFQEALDHIYKGNNPK